MTRYILKRLLFMIPVLISVTFVIFSMMYFTPGDPAEIILGEIATTQDKALFREQNGLDKPFIVQYLRYVSGIVLKGDLGTSYVTKRPVTIELVDRFPNTLKLALFGVAISVVIGVTGGIISATRQYSILDNVVTALSLLGVSIPSFWLGMILILFFAVQLGWLPASGSTSFKYYILPALTVGLVTAASIMRMTRSSMLEVIRQDYIRTARAKGQTESKVIWKHAFKNALIPVITVIGLQFGRHLGGIVIIESVFSMSGIGKLMIDAIKVKNSPMVQGGVLFIAIVMSVMNLIVDVLYGFVDPKIRSQYVRKENKKAITSKGGGTIAQSGEK